MMPMHRSQFSSTCTTLQQVGGDLHGYDLLRKMDVTPHRARVYMVLLYDVQPAYLMLVAYEPGGGDWKVE